MMRRQVVIVDYSLGNQTSVQYIVRKMGHRCIITDNRDLIARADLAILPGVGAYPAAMKILHQKQLSNVLIERAKVGLPIFGICLGMQLLAESSDELAMTPGLGLVPGKIKPIKGLRWHIGWNRIEAKQRDSLFYASYGQGFYFNHSHAYEGPDEFVTAEVNVGHAMPVAIRRNQIVGVQFHPEKSQTAGCLLIANVINSLCG